MSRANTRTSGRTAKAMSSITASSCWNEQAIDNRGPNAVTAAATISSAVICSASAGVKGSGFGFAICSQYRLWAARTPLMEGGRGARA